MVMVCETGLWSWCVRQTIHHGAVLKKLIPLFPGESPLACKSCYQGYNFLGGICESQCMLGYYAAAQVIHSACVKYFSIISYSIISAQKVEIHCAFTSPTSSSSRFPPLPRDI